MDGLESELRRHFSARGVKPTSIEIRAYPDETNALVFVESGAYTRALDVAESIEELLSDEYSDVLVVVRRRVRSNGAAQPEPGRNIVHGEGAAELVRLIAARNRVSDVQPSLSYVPDLAANVATVSAERHHLIFGRRGAGKSTLMVEAKRQITDADGISAWINLQTLRRDDPHRIFLRIAREMVGAVLTELSSERSTSLIVGEASDLFERLARMIQAEKIAPKSAERLIPDIQHVLRRGLELLARDLFVFIDDFYYVSREDQPELLDVLHGCVRDCRAWLKIASIRHLTRWFVANPPRGLQTGQDADIIDLDVTLEDPVRVSSFLSDILQRYALEVGIQTLTRLFRSQALDRLVLASGGVPRDYLVLSAAAIRKARERANARAVGVEEVNQVAGEAAAAKIQELEEDVAANAGLASRALDALGILRTFCLTEKSATFYGVDFFDKENFPREYQVFTDLLDLRLVHLIHSGVSDAHEAGRRYEIFMLDLSQYSARRLKHGLRVIDLQGDEIVSRRTRQAGTERRAATPRQLLSILRTAPIFGLDRFSSVANAG